MNKPLKQIKLKQKFTGEDDNIIKEIKKDLSDTEKFVGKQIKNIEKKNKEVVEYEKRHPINSMGCLECSTIRTF